MCTTGEGPNPWKTVIVFEELDIPYHATYLDFGNSRGGVEHEDFLKKIRPAECLG
jgi:glutathione S-transferase